MSELTETQNLKKTTTCLIDNCYDSSKTSLVLFHFEPFHLVSIEEKVQNCAIKHASIDGKDLYIFDGFFEKSESETMREFTKGASFSRNSYGSAEAITKGERPARSMNGRERWQLVSKSPAAISKLFQLFGLIADQVDAEVTTLPWELCDKALNGSPAVIANLLEEASKESTELGKHQDSNPEGKISYGIPVLYSDEKKFHGDRFNNGDTGKPWIVSAMLYTTEEGYLPEYQMGTVFYKKNGDLALSANCCDMRLVLFEGDVFHSIEASEIPEGINTWRTSYVFKLIINPNQQNQSVKKMFLEWINGLSDQIEECSIGPNSRA